jgi:ABC-type nitrate/sulfonate/bicarbonate transport system ATPase subunit
VSILQKLDFGSGASEFEDNLKDFFYRSISFAQAISEKTFVIVGSKGAGKSAIFRMFGDLQAEVPIFQHPNL